MVQWDPGYIFLLQLLAMTVSQALLRPNAATSFGLYIYNTSRLG